MQIEMQILYIISLHEPCRVLTIKLENKKQITNGKLFAEVVTQKHNFGVASYLTNRYGSTIPVSQTFKQRINHLPLADGSEHLVKLLAW